MNAELFEGFKVARNSLVIRMIHLSFGETTMIILETFKLLCFVSRQCRVCLNVNFSKSELIGIHMEKSKLHKYADIL